MPKESAARIQTSNLQACRHPDHYATGTLPSRNFAFPFSLLPWLQRAGFRVGCSCEKSIFHALNFFPHCSHETQTSLALQKNQAPKNDFSPHCSHETQTSPALQKTIFQALKKLFFFACLLSYLPTPPRALRI